MLDTNKKTEAEAKTKTKTKTKTQIKTRQCLVCRTVFESEWAGERICRKCKSTSSWRSGAIRGA
jgi:hypothetical protein